MKTKKNTSKSIGERHGVTAGTVRAWRRSGAPVDDPKKLKVWLAAHRNLTKPDQPLPSKGKQQPISDTRTGAASALRRLESAELSAFSDLQDALKGGDPLVVRACRESWIKISDSLRRYDLIVEQSRRDAGELLPKAELMELAKRLGRALYVGFTALHNSICPDLAAAMTPIEVSRILRTAFDEEYITISFKVFGKNGVNDDLVDELRRAMLEDFNLNDEAMAMRLVLSKEIDAPSTTTIS